MALASAAAATCGRWLVRASSRSCSSGSIRHVRAPAACHSAATRATADSGASAGPHSTVSACAYKSAAAAGKHLFVEKPLGFAGADSLRMCRAIEKAGVRFQTGYFMRGSPAHQFLKDALAGKPLPLATPREAAARGTVMEALYKAAATGRWIRPRATVSSLRAISRG